MLKIKDNVDLKELENFGFKPKYDCDTGEILFYYNEYFEEIFYASSGNKYEHYQIRIFKESVEIKKLGWLKKKSIKTNFIYDKPSIYEDGFGRFVDLLFDLISAGLVEKVGD